MAKLTKQEQALLRVHQEEYNPDKKEASYVKAGFPEPFIEELRALNTKMYNMSLEDFAKEVA